MVRCPLLNSNNVSIYIRTEHMGTGTLCREAEKSVHVPMCVNQVLNSYQCKIIPTGVYSGKGGKSYENS